MAKKQIDPEFATIQQAIKHIRELQASDSQENHVFTEALAQTERRLLEKLYTEVEKRI